MVRSGRSASRPANAREISSAVNSDEYMSEMRTEDNSRTVALRSIARLTRTCTTL